MLCLRFRTARFCLSKLLQGFLIKWFPKYTIVILVFNLRGTIQSQIPLIEVFSSSLKKTQFRLLTEIYAGYAFFQFLLWAPL